jgi:hypothetical protein
MLEALKQYLLGKPGLYLDDMAIFLSDEFEAVITSSTRRALASIGWPTKVARSIAKERNADLRDFYLYNLAAFRFHQLVYVDEPRCRGLNSGVRGGPHWVRHLIADKYMGICHAGMVMNVLGAECVWLGER